MFPISLRNGNPKSVEEVTVNNEMVTLSVKIPVHSNLKETGPKIKKLTKQLKLFEYNA